MRGYAAKSIENDPKIDHEALKSWARDKDMSSEFEAYAFASICFCCQSPGNCYEIHRDITAERKYIKHHLGYKM